MNIKQIANRLNEKAITEGFKIASLPELRKKYLGKKQLPSKIFTYHTIFERYAFHHGGRDEMQFNIGNENLENNKKYSRYALCFSLEASHSLPNPVQDLEPFRKRFNHCVEAHPEFFDGFEMWYYQDERHGNYKPQKISDTWFRLDTFICIGKVIEKPLEELNEDDFTSILEGFDKLLPIYEFCVLNNRTALEKLKIFTRLTSNDNNWELPSPHRWRKENQGKKNIPFENQYGFGHEEWLFNPRYNIEGYQYGFIRGIQRSKDAVSNYDEVHLYTVKKEKFRNLVYYLGHIKNVIVIKDDQREQKIIQNVIDQFNAEMMTEVENINGDLNGIIKFPFEAIVKFKLENTLFFDEPVFQPEFDLEKYKRFQPYKLSGSIHEIFTKVEDDVNGNFVFGKSSQTTVYNRKNRESSVVIEKLHSEIVEAFEKFLYPEYSLAKENISIETMRFKGNIADIVTNENKNTISIYEVKTSSSGRRNLREAIAQLLDYALHAGTFRINKLAIISPISLSKSDLAFLSALKAKIGFPLEYYCYQKNAEPQFILQS